MTILMWDKPKKVRTTEEWATHYGFESGPVGGYVPNMSEADQLSWKAKITGTKLGFPQVEIRKTTNRGSQVLIIVNLGQGYNYKQYEAVNAKASTTMSSFYVKHYGDKADEMFEQYRFPTKGINVHIATNGPIQMSFDELQDMNDAIEEAKVVLGGLNKSG